MENQTFYLCVLFKNLEKTCIVSNELFDGLNNKKKIRYREIYKILVPDDGETEVYVLNVFGKGLKRIKTAICYIVFLNR